MVDLLRPFRRDRSKPRPLPGHPHPHPPSSETRARTERERPKTIFAAGIASTYPRQLAPPEPTPRMRAQSDPHLSLPQRFARLVAQPEQPQPAKLSPSPQPRCTCGHPHLPPSHPANAPHPPRPPMPPPTRPPRPDERPRPHSVYDPSMLPSARKERPVTFHATLAPPSPPPPASPSAAPSTPASASSKRLSFDPRLAAWDVANARRTLPPRHSSISSPGSSPALGASPAPSPGPTVPRLPPGAQSPAIVGWVAKEARQRMSGSSDARAARGQPSLDPAQVAEKLTKAQKRQSCPPDWRLDGPWRPSPASSIAARPTPSPDGQPSPTMPWGAQTRPASISTAGSRPVSAKLSALGDSSPAPPANASPNKRDSSLPTHWQLPAGARPAKHMTALALPPGAGPASKASPATSVPKPSMPSNAPIRPTTATSVMPEAGPSAWNPLRASRSQPPPPLPPGARPVRSPPSVRPRLSVDTARRDVDAGRVFVSDVSDIPDEPPAYNPRWAWDTDPGRPYKS